MNDLYPDSHSQTEIDRSSIPVHTHNGRFTTVGELDHQHLSNWIHYSTWVYENNGAKELMEEELKERFDGQLLDYRPKSTFDHEIAELHRKNMLGKDGRIYNPHTNEVIGSVDYE